MALIGSSTIGLTFAMSMLVLSPWLNRLIGVPGIFALTGVLALLAVAFVRAVVPAAPPAAARRRALQPAPAGTAPATLRALNFGIFTLHAVLMAMFIMVPLALRDRSTGWPLTAALAGLSAGDAEARSR